jgi:photosystem II stability/assembly factor-like uncharacterized protein
VFRALVIVTLAATTAGIGLTLHTVRAVRNRAAASAALGAYDGESWQHLQRSYPTGRMAPRDALARAAEVRRRLGERLGARPGERRPPGLATRLALPGDTWVPIGPQPIFSPGHPFSGRVTAVAPHPTLANTIYLGADSGGIWRTTDGGATWTPLTDDIPVPAIQSLAVDPLDPRLIYATTIQRAYGTRWLRSTDAGETWATSSIRTADGRTLAQALCAINVFKACIPPSSGRILIDPARAGSETASRIYYAGLSHVLRSDDSGATFEPVLALDVDLDFAPNAPVGNPEAEVLRDLAIDPIRPDRLLAAIAGPRCATGDCRLMTSEVAVYRTLDAGGSWDRLSVAAIAPYSLDNTRYADPGAVYVPRVRVAIAPSNPDVAAVAIRDTQVDRPRVIRSGDGGATWDEVAPASNTITWPLDLAFAPGDADTMYVASAGVYRTTNGGASWTPLASTHVDNIDLAFDAAGVLITGNDGGIFRATSGNAFTDLNGALPITEFYSVAAHPSNPLLMAGGTQDNGTLVFQGNLGWSRIVGGDGGDTLFDPSPNAMVLYGEVEWFFIGARNVFLFFRCQPGGCVNRTAGIDTSLAGPFIPKMAMDPSNPATIWLTAERMFRTDARGDDWTAASPSVRDLERCWDEPETGPTCAGARYFTAVAVARTSPQTVYGGTLNGDVRVTNDRGASWRSLAGVHAGPLPVRAVNDIVVDPLDANTAYVAYSGFDSAGSGTGHIFRTSDGGLTWQDISGDLPDVPVNALLIDPESAGTGVAPVLYAGTDLGVFRATLGPSPSWALFGTGMPPVIVNDLAYNAVTRQLLAATYGRGIYAISSRFAR